MSKPASADVANELEILFPDREILVAGQTVTVRELRFAEQLKHHHLLAPLSAALEASEPTELAGLDSVNRIYDLLAAHEEPVVALVAISVGRDEAWVRALPAADGENLLLTWWGVNSGFFIRRVWRPKLVEQARRRRQATASSSPP
ncbi:hypothetical protein D3C78_874830 [compost metagenome]